MRVGRDPISKQFLTKQFVKTDTKAAGLTVEFPFLTLEVVLELEGNSRRPVVTTPACKKIR